MTIWLAYQNEEKVNLQASIHTDELESDSRQDHERYAIEKLLKKYPQAKDVKALPPLFA